MKQVLVDEVASAPAGAEASALPERVRVPQRRRKRQRLGESTVPAERLRAERPDQVWALDFRFDQTADGRILKLLHVVDEFTREPRDRVRPADRLGRDRRSARRPGGQRGTAPEHVRCDNGPELTAGALARLVWLLEDGLGLHRAGLALAEPLRRVLRVARARRVARGRAVRDPRRGPGDGRRLANRLQRAAHS